MLLRTQQETQQTGGSPTTRGKRPALPKWSVSRVNKTQQRCSGICQQRKLRLKSMREKQQEELGKPRVRCHLSLEPLGPSSP